MSTSVGASRVMLVLLWINFVRSCTAIIMRCCSVAVGIKTLWVIYLTVCTMCVANMVGIRMR